MKSFLSFAAATAAFAVFASPGRAADPAVFLLDRQVQAEELGAAPQQTEVTPVIHRSRTYVTGVAHYPYLPYYYQPYWSLYLGAGYTPYGVFAGTDYYNYYSGYPYYGGWPNYYYNYGATYGPWLAAYGPPAVTAPAVLVPPVVAGPVAVPQVSPAAIYGPSYYGLYPNFIYPRGTSYYTTWGGPFYYHGVNW